MRWEKFNLNYMISEFVSEIHGRYPLKMRGWQNIATTDSGNTQKLRVSNYSVHRFLVLVRGIIFPLLNHWFVFFNISPQLYSWIRNW